jgi:Uma2 family endonuclease
LGRDRNLKLPLYAEAGIQEYWIVNEQEQTIEVYLEPSGSGYRPARTYRRGETVNPSAFPDLCISLDEIFA